MSKGGGGGTNTVQKADPWVGQQPYLTDIYGESQRLYDQGPMQFYPGQTYASPSDRTIQAEEMIANQALGSQQVMANQAALANQFGLMQPQMLSENPYLAGATEAALRPVYGQAQGLLQQARRGATGAGQLGGTRQAILEQGVIGDYMQKAGDISSQMYSKAYQDSIDAQQRAISLAPSVMQMGLAPAQTLGQVGMSEQARQQQAIDESRARFEFGQQAPQQALRQYSDIALGNMLPGSQTTSMSGGDPSFMQRAIGGSLLGLGAYGAGVSTGAIGTGSAAMMTPGVGQALAATLAVASLFD
jgi:hypothetical protein|tara:strand:+ start:647 stop:1552 length:906 start_codon:yes stop_codon:yes gene_type:complete